jgi:indole-3-glycerol phosphate synthase
VQGPSSWTPPSGVLGALVDAAARRAVAAKNTERLLAAQIAQQSAVAPSFAAALRSGATVRVIAEVKRRSPSQGDLAPRLDAGAQTAAFAAGGAAAVSVLTEPDRFGGALPDLLAAAPVGLPMLRKDFIVDEIQLLEAAAFGASAVLLIARALPPARLRALYDAAEALGLDVLVEVHDAHELEQAIVAGYAIIGVNNRDLQTLVIDASVGATLVPRIPADRIAVFESGIQTPDDAARAAAVGADAILVGTALSRSADPIAAVRALSACPKRPRAS